MYCASMRQSALPIVFVPCVELLQMKHPIVNQRPPGVHETPFDTTVAMSMLRSGTVPSAGRLEALNTWMNCDETFVFDTVNPMRRPWPMNTARLDASAGVKAFRGSSSGTPNG